MASYINKNTNDFLPDKILTESILEENPVPTNVLPNPKLDEYLAVMLEGKKKYFEITRERSLNRIQGKIRDILGPLSWVWEAVSWRYQYLQKLCTALHSPAPPPPPPQGGGGNQCKGFTSEGRLHGENRPNRCLFFNPTPQELQKSPEISMARGKHTNFSAIVSGWAQPQEINGSTYQCIEENNDQISNLPR